MREGTIEQSTVVYRVIFERMLPALPTPGTVWFASLIKALPPHGVSPATTELEAPTGILNDVVLSFSLLRDRLKLKLAYGWLELVVTSLYETDEPTLIEVGDQLFSTLREIDIDFNQASARYRCYAHIKLLPTEAEEFLKQHLGNDRPAELVPDAFAYEIQGEQPMRVVVAKSSQFENALFLDLSIDYVTPDEPSVMVERINHDFERAANLLGLMPV